MTTANLDTQRVLQVDNLSVDFATQQGAVRAVRNVSFHVDRRETLAIVGESGSGKSVTSLSLMRLIEYGGGTITADGLRLRRRNGETVDMMRASDRQLQSVRGSDIAMIFQEPMTSLNPLQSIEQQVAEVLIEHKGMKRQQARARVLELFKLVGLPNPEQRLKAYPHELSGGQRQRVMIAMALACEPDILIADEPTTALDVTIQAQIMQLLKELQQKFGMAMLFITHDLDEAIRIGNRIAIMKDGQIVQIGTPEEIITAPADEYVAEFVKDISRLKLVFAHTVMQPLNGYQGEIPLTAEHCPVASPEADLGTLTDLAIAHDAPILVMEGDQPLGYVTRRDLLRGIKGDDAHE